MTQENRNRRMIVLSAAIAIFIWLTSNSMPFSFLLQDWPLIVFFACIIGFTLAYSIPIAGGSVSLMPLTAAGGFLILGRISATWAVLFGTIIHGLIRRVRGRTLTDHLDPKGWPLIQITALNLTMHSLSMLVAGAVFDLYGISLPLNIVNADVLVAFLGFVATYVVINYGMALLYFRSYSRASYQRFLTSFSRALAFEISPVIFSPLMALIYTRIGAVGLFMFSATYIISSLMAYFLAVASTRLQRRVQELASLQAVGHTLSASLDVEDVLSAIYAQVNQLIAARNFYVALYNATTDEVSFRFVVFDGVRVKRGSRKAANGLTEYIIRNREPMLLRGDINKFIKDKGIDHIGRDARCWIGVPLLAGNDILGTIVIQSYDDDDAYNQNDLELLTTIASQAALAVQNARLYSQTDTALVRRVEELDSVLRTTREGIILLDTELNVLAVNSAVAELFNVTHQTLLAQPANVMSENGVSLLALIHYLHDEFMRDCDMILDGTMGQVQRVIVDERTPRYLERTLTPVLAKQSEFLIGGGLPDQKAENHIRGWLLVFRDMTEEVELARLREDMTNMLVHDLRSPMTLVIGGLSLMQDLYNEHDSDTFEQMLNIAQRSSDRIMELINRLLDIGQLERGRMPINTQPLDIAELLESVVVQYDQMAEQNNIAVSCDFDDNLPIIHGDHSLLIRAFSNLMDNAIKFTPDGGLVRIWAHSDDEGTKMQPWRLLVGIYDNGPSIPEDAQTGLFEKFQQVRGMKGRRRGTGLGLPFCKLAIEAHGGKIWVDRKVTDGCQFVVALPLELGREADDSPSPKTVPLTL